MAAFAGFPYPALLITAVIRRGRAWREQDIMIRRLWAAVKRIPTGYVLTDPGTGELLGTERERGWLTLAVTDPPGRGAETVVTRYLRGRWAAGPLRPPAGIDPVAPPLLKPGPSLPMM